MATVALPDASRPDNLSPGTTAWRSAIVWMPCWSRSRWVAAVTASGTRLTVLLWRVAVTTTSSSTPSSCPAANAGASNAETRTPHAMTARPPNWILCTLPPMRLDALYSRFPPAAAARATAPSINSHVQVFLALLAPEHQYRRSRVPRRTAAARAELKCAVFVHDPGCSLPRQSPSRPQRKKTPRRKPGRPLAQGSKRVGAVASCTRSASCCATSRRAT